MRKTGSTFLLARERNDDLYRVYKESIKKQLSLYGKICRTNLFIQVVNSPASRYWVSPERATSVIYKMEKSFKKIKGERNIPTKGMKRNTTLFYESLYSEYKLYKEFHPEMTIKEVVAIVILLPAPCFILSPTVAGLIVDKMKRKCREQNVRQLNSY